MSRFCLRVGARWHISIHEHPCGAFASRAAAFACAIRLHAQRPASFDARAAEITTELIQRIHTHAKAHRTR